MNKIFNTKNWNHVKNIMLAAFIFGSTGAYLGAQFTNQVNARIEAAAKAAPAAQASAHVPK
jgi:hypothetical protein